MYQHRPRRILRAIVVISVLLAPASALAQTPADNTKVNTRDRAKGAVTADQQKENASDRELTQKIRRALMQDKTLSSYAHNVKVIAQRGQVTLKGPVRTEDEKRTVETKAAKVAGAEHVINEMSVAPVKARSDRADSSTPSPFVFESSIQGASHDRKKDRRVWHLSQC
jgi:hyperosmotically inducible periplasmic protein